MIHAYNEMYLPTVMKNIGELFDLAVNERAIAAGSFGEAFAESVVARQIENAVPDMLAGKSSAEMLSLILDSDAYYTCVPIDRTPEYWSGWVLAKAQWELNKPFKELLGVMPLPSLIAMYYPYHEADEEKITDIIKSRFPKKEPTLKSLRKEANLTQEQLAVLSGVNIRSIRSYEQGKNELSKARGETLERLANALGCRIEALLDYS